MESAGQVVVVEPPQRWPRPGLRKLWSNRELAYFITWRDVKIRYKQSLIGFGWAVIQPLLSMIAFTVVFQGVANIPSEGLPYPVFVLAGLLPWIYFSNAVSFMAGSLVSNMALVTKIYFPRILLPLSGVLTWLVDFGVSFLLLLVVMAVYGIIPPLTVLLLPLLVFYLMLTATALGLWLSALNVKFRDIRYTLPFLMQLWLFLTPVIYPGSSAQNSFGSFDVIYALNPMVGAIETFRWAILGTPAPSASFVLPSLIAVTILLVSGWIYFLRTEQSFADVI